MSVEELQQVKEILGSGLKLVISDRPAKRPRKDSLANTHRKEPISLRTLLGIKKNENKEELAIILYDYLIDHPRIRRVSRPHWNNKQYRSAVLDAQIELENMVKERANYPKDNRGKELSGTSLMHKVFDVKNPILKWSDLKTRVLQDELDGYKLIFAGSVLGIRNPNAHLVFKQTAWRALQILVFTCLLAELVDRCKYCEVEEH
jgi:uncharacterized protein (TIGR02391 family)